jgi:hypothetical protein
MCDSAPRPLDETVGKDRQLQLNSLHEGGFGISIHAPKGVNTEVLLPASECGVLKESE